MYFILFRTFAGDFTILEITSIPFVVFELTVVKATIKPGFLAVVFSIDM